MTVADAYDNERGGERGDEPGTSGVFGSVGAVDEAAAMIVDVKRDLGCAGVTRSGFRGIDTRWNDCAISHGEVKIVDLNARMKICRY